MKKLLLLSFMVMAFVTSSFADEATFDFTNPTGLTPAVTPAETAGQGVEAGSTTFTNSGVSISFATENTGANPVYIWTAKGPAYELRVYKTWNMTVAAPTGKTISKIAFTGGKVADASMTPNSGTYASKEWTGSASEVVFAVSATLNISTMTVTFGEEGGENPGGGDENPGGGDENPGDELSVLYSESFSTGLGDFTADNKLLPEGSTYVWSFDSRYKVAKASAFVGGGAKASESWLVSPQIDLTEATDCTLSFAHAANYFANIESEIKAMIKAEGGEWTELSIDNYPTCDKTFPFVTATFDLKAYDGKKINVALVYTSTAEAAGTYEVKDFVVKGKGAAVVVPDVPDYTTIADLKAAATGTAVKATYTFSDLLVTAIAKKGNNYSVYVTDGTEGMQFYGPNEPAFAKGDKINGKVAGNLVSYNGLTEISAADYAEVTVASSNNEVVPVKATLAAVKDDTSKMYENLLVTIEEVAFAAEALENGNITMVDESDNELVLRDNFAVLTDFIFDTTKNYNVTGIVQPYKGTAQVYPLSADDVQMITNLVNPETAWAEKEVAVLAGEAWTVNNALTTASDAGKTFTSSNENVATVAEDGAITVKGYGHTTITVETAENATYLASKASFDLYIIEGKGTLAEPYSVADALYFFEKVTGQVWVKGTISGSYVNNKFTEGAENAPASNLAIGTAEENLPVEMKSGGAIRAAYNLKDNPDMLGKEVWFCGELTRYFSVAGLKNLTDASTDGKETITGIDGVAVSADKNAAVYTLDGRRVQKAAAGLYIVNGKKVFVK